MKDFVCELSVKFDDSDMLLNENHEWDRDIVVQLIKNAHINTSQIKAVDWYI